jgi:hypothetical protein
MGDDNMEDAQLLAKIIRRLDILITLGLESVGESDGMCLADKIAFLSELGLAPAEISDIVRKPINYITATISRRKKKKSKGDKGNGRSPARID